LRRRRAKKHGEQSLGRSCGGFSTKIHLATDALGNALRFLLTGGERNDITQAATLVEDFVAVHVIADKGYDSEAFVLYLKAREAEAVIPSRTTHKVQREIDTHLYKERHLIENQIGKVKQFRRVFWRLFRFCVSGDNQPFSLERTERLCHFHPNCLMSC
jgi:transposase